jgi:hypothetical protein
MRGSAEDAKSGAKHTNDASSESPGKGSADMMSRSQRCVVLIGSNLCAHKKNARNDTSAQNGVSAAPSWAENGQLQFPGFLEMCPCSN